MSTSVESVLPVSRQPNAASAVAETPRSKRMLLLVLMKHCLSVTSRTVRLVVPDPRQDHSQSPPRSSWGTDASTTADNEERDAWFVREARFLGSLLRSPTASQPRTLDDPACRF